jgi:hypothetical protein
MPIITQWDNDEKTIVRHDFQGRWTWEEFFEAERRANELVATVTHRVDIISNMREGAMPHQGALANARSVIHRLKANLGVIVVVVNPLLAATTKVFKKVDKDFDRVVRAANSVQDARQVIEQERAKAAYTTAKLETSSQ